MERPYRAGLRLGVGAGLVAALILAGIDIGQAAGKAGGMGFAPVVLALWGTLGVVIGGVVGVVAGAINATWGDEAIVRGVRRLRTDHELDVTYAALVLAVAAMLVLLALLVSRLAVPLVAGVQRQSVGALLLGVVIAAVVPVLAALMIPVFRVTRRIAGRLPALGTTPRTIGLLVLGPVTLTGAALFFIFTRLDWRALGMGSLGALVGLPVLTLAVAGIAARPLRVRLARWRSRGWFVLVGAVIVVVLAPVLLMGKPSRAVEIAVTEHSLIGPRVIPRLKKMFDKDGDGFSNFFSATMPDCDDHNKKVNPDADEVPGNGIDDNCEGGDRAADATEPHNGSGSGSGSAGSGSGTGTGTGTGSGTGSGGGSAVVPVANRLIKFDGNVLWVMIDTVRADRLGVAGYKRDGKSLTPVLDKLAGEAVWFTHAYAQAPNTPRSVPSFWTSRYPSQVKLDPSVDPNYPTVLDDNVTLFEALQPAGLRTVGVTSHFFFCDGVRRKGECDGFKKPKKSNIGQGADDWTNDGVLDVEGSNHDIAAPRIIPRAIKKLEDLGKSKQRFAMFVHLFDPHSTYMEHEGFPANSLKGTPGLMFKYDYEVAFDDQWIGKLIDALAANGLADNTMIVVMADHGEAFAVHTFAGEQMFFHGQTLYDELLHVPVLIKVPGVAPRKVDDVVQLIDLAPTVVDVLGIAKPAPWVGRSLVPAMLGQALPPQPSYAELLSAPSWPHKAKSMISGDGKWHLFFRQEDKRYELYDLTKDPAEKTDVFTATPDVGNAMVKQLNDWLEVGLKHPPGG